MWINSLMGVQSKITTVAVLHEPEKQKNRG